MEDEETDHEMHQPGKPDDPKPNSTIGKINIRKAPETPPEALGTDEKSPDFLRGYADGEEDGKNERKYSPESALEKYKAGYDAGYKVGKSEA